MESKVILSEFEIQISQTRRHITRRDRNIAGHADDAGVTTQAVCRVIAVDIRCVSATEPEYPCAAARSVGDCDSKLVWLK